MAYRLKYSDYPGSEGPPDPSEWVGPPGPMGPPGPQGIPGPVGGSATINVKDFGAIGDGMADDTAAIQAALNAVPAGGAEVFFPAGTYRITAALTANGNISIRGSGVMVTTIVQATAGANGIVHHSAAPFQMFGISLMCNGVGGTALDMDFGAASVSDFTMTDVNIVGNGNQTANFWHDGIVVNNCNVLNWNRVWITGTNQGSLSNIGNGIYWRPPQSPAPDTGSYVQLLYACGVNYYQNGIVIDSTGHTANIQGTILHACNFNMCMQGIRVLGTCLQLTLEGCQYEGFGSAIHAEGADTVVVRDSLFFTTTSASMAIAAQLPQDVFVGQGGGNWWIEANRFILQPSSTVRYIFNLTSSFNAGAFRDNVIWAQGATATGAFNLASGTANVVESGTVFEFWNAAWPYWTNANSGGGIGNLCSFGALATTSNLSATQWQNQGAYVCWNLSGGILGGTNFVNSRGGGGGGFGFYDTASTIGSTPTLLANINSTGINNAPIGIGTPAAGSFTTLAASGTVSGTGFSNFLASPPAIGGTTPAAGKFTTVTANSATFAGGAAQVTADTVLAEIAVGVAGLANISGTQWQQQGAWSGWNFQGTSGLNGETDFINSRGGGSGGFAWFVTASTSGSTPALAAKLDASGNFTANALTAATSFITVAANLANVLPATGLSASFGWNYLNGAGEIDYWDNYTGGVTMSHVFWQRTAGSATRLMDINPTGAVTAYGGFVVSAATGPTIRAGTGVATGTQPSGSLWLRTDGAAGARLYVSAGAGTWVAVASV